MALTDENGNGMVMPVAPLYNNNGGGFGNFGGDWGWIILLLLIAGGGWGMGGFGMNGWGMGFDGGLYPWMNQANLTANGFQNAALNDSVTSIRDGIAGLSTQLCNGFSQAEISNNARQMADMQQMFGIQTALQNCCCENRAGIADLKYTVATENCADRTAAYQNTQAIIEAGNRNSQAILDKLCQLELDNVKQDNANLRTQLNMANLAASQTAQNALIQQGLNNEVDALYNRLSSCPVPSTPVYGRTPIFTCNNGGCGCGCNM
jgi:hypothetical protein